MSEPELPMVASGGLSAFEKKFLAVRTSQKTLVMELKGKGITEEELAPLLSLETGVWMHRYLALRNRVAFNFAGKLDTLIEASRELQKLEKEKLEMARDAAEQARRKAEAKAKEVAAK